MLKAGTNKELIDSVFHVGGTVDVIIRKVTKNTVKVTYQNNNFTLNKWGVLCAETLRPDGKIWYSFCPFQYPEKEIINAINEWKTQKTNVEV